MREVFSKFNNFKWGNIDTIEYKKPKDGEAVSFNNVLRQNIVESDDDIGFDVRYFECAKGGYTSLEKHEHVHVVLTLRGSGSIIVGKKVYNVQPFDLTVIPSWAEHQLVNTGEDPFGFVCTVNGDRDKPTLLSKQETRELMETPELSAVIKAAF